jgi:hypothetical protein
LWHRRRKIIAAGFRKLEELSSHDGAHGMTADVFSTRIAASVSEEPRQGLRRAIFESIAKDILGRFWPTPSVPAVIPQHRRPLDCRQVHNTRNRRPPTVGAGACPPPCRNPAQRQRPSSAGHLERLRKQPLLARFACGKERLSIGG